MSILYFGEDSWNTILSESGCEFDFFLNTHPYTDEVTLSLVSAAARVNKISVDEFLIMLGGFWVLNTAEKYYGTMLLTLGNNVKDFLTNLVTFHNRVEIMYPNMKPPTFQITDITDNSLVFHYISTRKGLKNFMVGLLQGVGKRFNTELSINYLGKETSTQDANHEIFKVSWN
jgi:hypothetical protein